MLLAETNIRLKHPTSPFERLQLVAAPVGSVAPPGGRTASLVYGHKLGACAVSGRVAAT